MGSTEMGRHWSTEEEWKVSTMREIKRLKEKISKKCVPLAKATRMTKSQKAVAVRRKRAAGKPKRCKKNMHNGRKTNG